LQISDGLDRFPAVTHADDTGRPEVPAEDASAAESGGISRRKLVGTGIAAIGATVVWGSPVPFSRKGIGAAIDSAWAGEDQKPTGHHQHGHTGDEVPGGRPEDTVGYCSVAGNTYPDGSPIPPGTFIPLAYGLPDEDEHYRGATLANYIEGKGITCEKPPSNYVLEGFADSDDVPAGLYPFWAKP
jgi:hypothetical protein